MNRRLGGILLLMALPLSGCLQTNDSVSSDNLRFGAAPSSPGEGHAAQMRFTAARQVINQNCLQCHANFGGFSESQFEQTVTRGGLPLVKAGAPQESELFMKLKRDGGPGDMPLNGAPLTPDEVNAIEVWIAQMAHAAAPVSPPTTARGPTPAPGPVAPVDVRLASAIKVLQTNCLKCHGVNSDNGDFATYLADDTFLKATTLDGSALVMAGSAEKSPLYMKLKGTGFPGANMPAPKAAAPLEAADLQAIHDWIENIKTN